jgi:hypothetical protein
MADILLSFFLSYFLSSSKGKYKNPLLVHECNGKSLHPTITFTIAAGEVFCCNKYNLNRLTS